MDIEIKPIDKIVGEIEMPGDKSVSHRLVMIGSISNGETIASNFLSGEDCLSTVSAFRKMGVSVISESNKLKIKGVGLRGLKKPETELYLGNSGTTMRLISGILAGQDFESILTGDESLSKRPMKRVMEPLIEMGADIISINKNNCAPLKIKGKPKLSAINHISEIASAQVKSCVLFAGMYGDGHTQFEEPFQSRDHTERMLKYFGADIRSGRNKCSIKSEPRLTGKKIFIPGDISSAAFFIVLSTILEGSEIVIRMLGSNPTRTKILDVLGRMGADISVIKKEDSFEPLCDLKIKSAGLSAATITEDEIPNIIDEIPALCVAAAKAKGTTRILGAGELRVKETDRVASMVENLRALGVEISVEDNNIFVKGDKKRFSKKTAANLNSFGDHRTAMAMCVAACASEGSAKIHDIDCIKTSFPAFFDILNYVKH